MAGWCFATFLLPENTSTRAPGGPPAGNPEIRLKIPCRSSLMIMTSAFKNHPESSLFVKVSNNDQVTEEALRRSKTASSSPWSSRHRLPRSMRLPPSSSAAVATEISKDPYGYSSLGLMQAGNKEEFLKDAQRREKQIRREKNSGWVGLFFSKAFSRSTSFVSKWRVSTFFWVGCQAKKLNKHCMFFVQHRFDATCGIFRPSLGKAVCHCR